MRLYCPNRKSYDHLSSLRETVKEFHDSPTVASLCRPPGKVPKEPRKKFTEVCL